jgi:hypothetical protein
MRDIGKIQAQIGTESEVFKERLRTPEAREAFAAFAERRPPNFDNLTTGLTSDAELASASIP